MARSSTPLLPDPFLVVADLSGNLFEVPGLLALARSGGIAVRPHPVQYKPLPEGTLLFHLPGRKPVGWDPKTARPVTLDQFEGKEVCAVAAFLPPAYTLLFLSAWSQREDLSPLPLYAYCAVGFRDGGFVAPAVRVDPDVRQDVGNFHPEEIDAGAVRMLARFPTNRLVEHLVTNCVRRYCCPAARNFVLGRFEAPLPTSPACNADCVGCISEQPGGDIPVTQPRLKILPTAEEIAEVAVAHLEEAPRPVVSFGQGCEGEPLLRAEVIEKAIQLIRSRTNKGTVNLNTNASRPEAVKRLAAAGLNQIRISLNSARRDLYERYFRPRNYTFDDVLASGRAVAEAGGLVSLNYFIFPGITDTEAEYAALQHAVETAGVRFIQMRNLNLDPDLYLRALELPPDLAPGFGVDRWMKRIRQAYPGLGLGYFNPPRENWPPMEKAGKRGN